MTSRSANHPAHGPLTDCARQHKKACLSLTPKELNRRHELPCGCGEASLDMLLDDHPCPDCDEYYFYSFCWRTVVQDGDTWHCTICRACRACRDWREWHCKNCNKCTYGVRLPCEGCGKKSEVAELTS